MPWKRLNRRRPGRVPRAPPVPPTAFRRRRPGNAFIARPENDRRTPYALALAPERPKAAGRFAQLLGSDKRYKILGAHIKKFLHRQDALIEVLHKAQELFGYLEDDLLRSVAWQLKLPSSRVYGVATFHHFFTLKPPGEHACVVCLGTACYVKGSHKVLAAIEDRTHIKAGETTPDNKLSLLTARCIGACGIAPAVVYDGQVAPKQSPADVLKRVNQWI